MPVRTLLSTPFSMSAADPPVVVIGAGPVGLAAAAHLSIRGLPFLVLEAGDRVGAAVAQWGHIRTFTPWRYIVDSAAEKLLAPTGWSVPTTRRSPTGAEVVTRYLTPLAGALGDRVHTGARVVAVSREGLDRSRGVGRETRPFVVRIQHRDGAVEDVEGPRRHRRLGHLGPAEPARQPRACPPWVSRLPGPLDASRGHSPMSWAPTGHGSPAAPPWSSAWGTRPRTRSWRWPKLPARTATPGWCGRSAPPRRDGCSAGETADDLPDRGRLGSDLQGLVSLRRRGAGVAASRPASFASVPTRRPWTSSGTRRRASGRSPVSTTSSAATGFRPDLDILAELRLDLDLGLQAPRAIGPLVDPAVHSCGSVPPHGWRELAHDAEPGFFVVGMKSYGRAPTFLITTGNEQVRSVVAHLAGDDAAADEVQLVLPETGVCSSGNALPTWRWPPG